jgi:mono/diheme cytochrome c family protein
MRIKLLIVLLVVIAGIGASGYWWVTAHGFTARAEPSGVEALIAGYLRHLSTPGEAREAKNPVAATPEVISEAMAHFADHCASCHANDGSGGTDLGLSLYPPPPDLRQPGTQQLTDGEIFYIIHNGVRFTGMPAFGGEDASTDMDSWKLVHFIRHLPDITVDELDAMKKMNPRSPMQIEMEEHMRKILKGQDTEEPSSSHVHHKQ